MSVPSWAAPALTFANAEGRQPPTQCSSSRSSISLTGRLALRASSAHVIPCTSGPNFDPKPPPMNGVSQVTLRLGMFLYWPLSVVAVGPTAWVEA